MLHEVCTTRIILETIVGTGNQMKRLRVSECGAQEGFARLRDKDVVFGREADCCMPGPVEPKVGY